MQMHSAMHLMCSLIKADVTGGSVGAEKSRLDFDLKDEVPDKEKLTEKINQLIQKGAEITTEWWDKEKLEKHSDLVRTAKVYPPSENGKYRMVKIGDIDLQPCGGTHVKNIQEIGDFTKFIKSKKRKRKPLELDDFLQIIFLPIKKIIQNFTRANCIFAKSGGQEGDKAILQIRRKKKIPELLTRY